jgi:hypothetical protein
MVGLVVPMVSGNPNEALLLKAAKFLVSLRTKPSRPKAGKPLVVERESLQVPYVHDMTFRGWRAEIPLMKMKSEAFVAAALAADMDEPVAGFDIQDPTVTVTSPRFVIGKHNPLWDKGGRFATCVRVDRSYVWVIVDERTKTILMDETLQYFLEQNGSPKMGLHLNYWAGAASKDPMIFPHGRDKGRKHHYLNAYIATQVAVPLMAALAKNENKIVSEACMRAENTSGIPATVGAEISIGQIKHNGIIIKTLEKIESPEVAPAVLFFIKNKDVPIRNLALLDGKGYHGWYEISHLGRNRFRVDRPFTCPNITSKFAKLLGNWKAVSA